jgi:hypothetical protein
MNTNESANPESALNTSENNESKSAPFDIKDLSNLVKASFLSEPETVDVKESENKSEETPEVEVTGVEDNEVLSEQPEVTSSDEDELETENSDEENSDSSNSEETERGLPKGVKKRIDKLIAKKREAEQEIERLKQDMERLEQEANKPAQTPTKDNPYSNLNTASDIQKEIEQAKQIRRWCELNPDGAVVRDANGNETEYTSEEIRGIKVKALDAIEEHLPKRLDYIKNYQQIEQIATKEYPWWKDKSSQERQIAEAFMKHFPEIQRFPDYKMVLGDYIRGVKTREQSQKKTSPQKPPSQPKSVAAPIPMSRNDAKNQLAKKKFTTSGSREDLSAIIASKFI